MSNPELTALQSRIDTLLDAQFRLLVRAEIQRALYQEAEQPEPEMKVVQGGKCWGCGFSGYDMEWFNITDAGDPCARTSHLIHKNEVCRLWAERRADGEYKMRRECERDDIDAGRQMSVSVFLHNGEEWRGVLYPVGREGRRA